jgi:shikimate kinase
MNYYLVGFMGSGKSFVGKQLAEKLNLNFIDLDDLIEAGEGETIAEIFEKRGEAVFRTLERKYLQSTFINKNTILATGGGTACFFDNMNLMNQKGTTIFLNPTVDLLINRLESETAKRPLLQEKTNKELHSFISQKLENRLKYYQKSKIIVNITSFENDVVEMCFRLLDS